MEHTWSQPALAGAVTAMTGFAGTAAVVVAGLTAAGASTAQAATGLTALCLAQGAGTAWLSYRYRRPITLAWSTPGAALLASAGAVAGGWPAVVGAFVVAALITGAIAASTRFSHLVARVPVPLAQAMLAAILLPTCLHGVTAAAAAPLLALPILVAWFLLLRRAPRWATAGAFGASLVVIAVVLLTSGTTVSPLPKPEITPPAFTLEAGANVALPLVLVAMVAQNVPGAAVLAAHGYVVPWRSALLVTAGGSLVTALAGGHGITLAALTAALPASSQAHPDRSRRWMASATCGLLYLALGALAPLFASLLSGPVDGVVRVAAGLALLPTLVAALASALATESARLPAAVTLVVGASDVAIVGIGPALWSIAAGSACWLLLGASQKRRATEA